MLWSRHLRLGSLRWIPFLAGCLWFAGEGLAKVIAIMEKYHALADAKAQARGYDETALAALAGFATSPVRDALSEGVRFCIERAH